MTVEKQYFVTKRNKTKHLRWTCDCLRGGYNRETKAEDLKRCNKPAYTYISGTFVHVSLKKRKLSEAAYENRVRKK